jgi:hypothetical protein
LKNPCPSPSCQALRNDDIASPRIFRAHQSSRCLGPMQPLLLVVSENRECQYLPVAVRRKCFTTIPWLPDLRTLSGLVNAAGLFQDGTVDHSPVPRITLPYLRSWSAEAFRSIRLGVQDELFCGGSNQRLGRERRSSHLSISNHANKTENATLQLDQPLGSVKPTETYLIGKTVEPGRNWSRGSGPWVVAEDELGLASASQVHAFRGALNTAISMV